MRKHTKSLLACLMAFAMLPLSGCAQNNAQEADYTVYVITKSKATYWDAVEKGSNDAGEEMNIDVIYQSPELEDAAAVEEQKQLVQNAIDNHADAIVIAAIDDTALNDLFRQATSSNPPIPILTIDSTVSYTGVKTYIGTQNEAAGAIAARHATGLVSDTGTIGIVAHSQGTPIQIARTDSFVDSVKTSGSPTEAETTIEVQPVTDADGNEIPGAYEDIIVELPAEAGSSSIKVLDPVFGEGDATVFKETAKNLLSSNPDIELVYATNQTSTIGLCSAVEELALSDKVQVIGFDYFPAGTMPDGTAYKDAGTYLTNGVLDGTIVQNPYNMGYLGVRYSKKLIEGESVASIVDTGATLVTKDNLEEEDIQWLVNN